MGYLAGFMCCLGQCKFGVGSKNKKMKYEINEKLFNITISGSKKELKNFVWVLEKTVSKESRREALEEKLKQLENLNDKEKSFSAALKAFSFNQMERIYFNENNILYCLNISQDARKYMFPLLKENLEKAKKIYEN